MKARKTFLKTNLFKIILLATALFIGLSVYRSVQLSKRANLEVSNGRTSSNPVKKRRLVNRVLTWMSANINKRKGGNFWKESKKSSSSKYHSLWINTEDLVALTSNYDYKGLDDQVSMGQNDTMEPPVDMQNAAVQTGLPNGRFEIPIGISGKMTTAQHQSVSELTANMSSEAVISKLNEDKAFRESMQNASGMEITKDTFGPDIRP